MRSTICGRQMLTRHDINASNSSALNSTTNNSLFSKLFLSYHRNLVINFVPIVGLL